MQDPTILEKSLRSSFKIKQFRNLSIWYQGSYELDFLEKYYDIYNDIQRGPCIKYRLNDKDLVYHSDFYIPTLNLVVEIKSDWTVKSQGEHKTIEKGKATIANGFNYILIINKDYSELNRLITTDNNCLL